MAVEAPVKPAKSAIDWQAADSIALKLGGRVALDVREADDRAFFEGLELGQDVELLVTGTVVSVAAVARRTKEGDFAGFEAVRVISLGSVAPFE
jgi:hypothetical protein